ncbi:myosin-10-like [Phlebotomus argentipes]|uniref:myosin-10-like n=1 Tax=Phlebotomus argentipes TaxID=94469 RepID=UPI002892C1BA|nr:myosin-10-like [Phlebotomus argentipes]
MEGEQGQLKTPKLEVDDYSYKIHTPNITFPSLEDSIESKENYKILYQNKCKELDDFAEFKGLEMDIYKEEKARLDYLEQENESLKTQVTEICAMRSEVEAMRREVNEKGAEVVRSQREKADTESRVAGIEMQFEQYKSKMTGREKELLMIIESNGDLTVMKESLAKMKTENDRLRMEVEQEKMAREEEIAGRERMIENLRDEINQSEKARHESEKTLLNKIEMVEQSDDHSEKISQLYAEVNNMRDVILELQSTISILETENKELSIKISETTMMNDDVNSSDSTIKGDNNSLEDISQFDRNEASLMEFDQTLLCQLVGNAKTASSANQQKMRSNSFEILQNERKSLVEENEKLSGQLIESVQESDELKKSFEEEQRKVAELQEQLDKEKTMKLTYIEDLKDAKASVEILQRDKDGLMEEKAAQKEGWREEKAELEKMIMYHSEKATRCEEKIMELNITINDLVIEKETLNQNLEASQLKFNNNLELHSQYGELTEKYKAVVLENTGNEKEIAKLVEERKRQDLKIDAIMYELESLREKATSDEDLIKEKERKIIHLQRSVDKQEALVKSLEEEMCQLKVSNNVEEGNLGHEQQKLRKEKEWLEEERRKLTQRIEDIQVKNEEQCRIYSGQILNNSKIIDDLVLENTDLTVKSRDTFAIIVQLRNQIAAFRNAHAELNCDNSQLRSDYEELRAAYEELEREKSFLLQECASVRRASELILSNQQKDLNEQNELSEKLRWCETEVVTLQARLREQENVNCDTMKTLEDLKNTHETKVVELKVKISDEEEKQRQLQTEKDQLDSVNRELTCVVQELKSVLERLKGEITQNEKDLSVARKSEEQLKKEIEQIQEKHREEIENVKTEKKASDESANKEQIDQLKEMLAAKLGAHEQLSSKWRSAEQRINELERENESNCNELESLRERITHVTEMSTKSDEEVAMLRLELEQKTKLINGLTERANKMQDGDSERVKEELKMMKKQKDCLTAECEKLKKVADEKTSAVNELMKRISDKSVIIESLEKCVAMNKQNAPTKASDDEIASLQREKEEILKETRTMKVSLEKKIKSLKDANEHIVFERDSLKKKLTVINEKDNDIKLLKERIKKKEKTIEKLNDLVAEKGKEIDELKFKKSDHSTGSTGRDSSPTGLRPTANQKERRKSDRQSLYDVNRSINYNIERDVAVMTDPTSESCQCQALADKISNLRNENTVLEYKLSTAERNLDKHPLNNDFKMLKRDMTKKDLTISSLTTDLMQVQQDLRRAEAKIKCLVTEKAPAVTQQISSQTDASPHRDLILRSQLQETKNELKRIQEKCAHLHSENVAKCERIRELEDGATGQKENDAANFNTDSTTELAELRQKYNNLKRVYFLLRYKNGEA